MIDEGRIDLKKISLEFAAYTDVGNREINEDDYGIVSNSGLAGFFLCDGLGGHGMGDQASQLVVSVFSEMLNNADTLKGLSDQMYLNAQSALLQKQAELRVQQKMKTTAVSLITDGKKIQICHVGDSRIYFFNNGKIIGRTLDHSVPQMLVISKQIKEEEIRNHPERSILLRVMGIPWDGPKYELMKPVRVTKYNSFLLCSDGFWELINEKEMEECFADTSGPAEWLEKMRSIAAERGKTVKMDNNTAIAVKIK